MLDRRLSIATAALCLTTHALLAQRAPAAPPLSGHALSAAATVSADSAARRCLDLGDNMWADDVRQAATHPCRALGIHDAGIADGRIWSYAHYARVWLLPGDAGAPPDTVRETELVLFTVAERDRRADSASGRAATLTPVWHERSEADAMYSTTPTVAPAPGGGGGALVAIEECVNGTGGCSQNIMLYRGDSLHAVRLAFIDSLEHRFPGSIQHGFHVDVRTLAADAAIYSDGDANCCPSRTAIMTLRLRGDALEIATLRLEDVRLRY